MRLAIAVILALLAVALAALGFALREAATSAEAPRHEELRSLSPAPSPPEPAAARAEDEPFISTAVLRVGPEGGPPGRAKVAAPPLEFEVEARSYASGPDGLVLKGLTVRNATGAAAFDVTFYALATGLGPAGERLSLGDVEAGGATRPADMEIPIALPPEKDPPALSFYLAYRVARDETTWLLSSVYPVKLEPETGR